MIAALTFPIAATPAFATTGFSSGPQVTSVTAANVAQNLVSGEPTGDPLARTAPIESFLAETEVEVKNSAPANFDVKAAIALAEEEIGTSRPTGWSQPGECIMSAQRWILAGGGAWTGSGNPVDNYRGATRVALDAAQPGDIIQYELASAPTVWAAGVHTLMITENNGDGTFTIIESNNPGGSGLVQKQKDWVPQPPSGFQVAVWRF
ncbi:lipase [Leucobacter sp. M11]|uniref:lipase n=1 Tax=Leucobacter sp. M11 TaxID=2993565 RepID=UPI002D808BE1|nr:lipase [Leucobacter sp. M11]MEB4614613.1 lipase [Leucobacter sp. M11]